MQYLNKFLSEEKGFNYYKEITFKTKKSDPLSSSSKVLFIFTHLHTWLNVQ